MNLVKFVMILVMGGAVGGCVPDDEGSLDARCDRRAAACMNSCYKAGQGSACRRCCSQATGACKRDESFSFYECPDKDDPR